MFVFAAIVGISNQNHRKYIEAELVAKNETYSFFSDGKEIYPYNNINIPEHIPYVICVENDEVKMAWISTDDYSILQLN